LREDDVKNVLLAISLVTLSMSSGRATDIFGDVWGVWDTGGSPYYIIGDARVPPESTLEIEAGVAANFITGSKLVIDSNAALFAYGTVSDSIIFHGGRGIKFIYADSSFFSHCVITGMIGDRYGPIKIDNGIVLFENCRISGNRTDDASMVYGGAVAGLQANLGFDGCRLIGNWAMADIVNPWPWCEGGAIYLQNSSARLKGTIFLHNVAWGIQGAAAGGAISADSSIIDIRNCSFYGNDAWYTHPGDPTHRYRSGTGIAASGTQGTLTNNIIFNYLGNDLSGQGLELAYNDIGSGEWPGSGNINIDPLFADTAAGDLSLLAGSPCIDAGDPESPLDPDGSRADMGALPYSHPVRIDEAGERPTDFALAQNFPNPFNAKTSIAFELRRAGRVRLEVFDVLGAKVATILEGHHKAGQYEVEWDAKGVASGIYQYRLVTNYGMQNKRMVLQK
jgi:hypothetical protein